MSITPQCSPSSGRRLPHWHWLWIYNLLWPLGHDATCSREGLKGHYMGQSSYPFSSSKTRTPKVRVEFPGWPSQGEGMQHFTKLWQPEATPTLQCCCEIVTNVPQTWSEGVYYNKMREYGKTTPQHCLLKQGKSWEIRPSILVMRLIGASGTLSSHCWHRE